MSETVPAPTPQPRHIRAGLAALVAALALDQAFKLWMLFSFDIAARGAVAVCPYLDLVLVWNTGISYGLFPQDSEAGRWALIAIKLLASVLFGFWLFRAETKATALGLGLVIAGALGNAIDRLLWGAVADFFSFHIGTLRWYVFNVADAAIVVGVGLLLYDGLLGPAAKKPA